MTNVTTPPRPFPSREIDEAWMRAAIEQAKIAWSQNEVPVGAIVVFQGNVIGAGYNLREALQDPTEHAEVVAIRQAAQHLGSWRLIDCTMYVTLEPCPMCAGALVNSRVARVVWGCNDPKAGAVQSLFEIGRDPRLNHRFDTTQGILQETCSKMLTDFFREARAQNCKVKSFSGLD